MAIYIKGLLIQFKRKPILSIFMLVCFIASALTVSLISSMIKEEMKKVKEQNFGYNEEQIVSYSLGLKEDIGKYDDVKKAFDILKEDYMIKLYKNGDLNGERTYIREIYSKNNLELDIKMYSGRIISTNTPYEAVIGKEINDKLGSPESITLFDEKFKVVGVSEGYNNKIILINGDSIDKHFMGNAEFSKEKFTVQFIKKDGNIDQKDKQKIENQLNKINNIEICNDMSDKKIYDNNLGQAYLDKKQDIKLNSLLIIIAICNIMVASTFWIMDRKKEIAIRKAFGAEKKHIISLVYKELGSLMFLALIISVIIQYGFSKVLTGFLGSTLIISFTNLIILTLMAFIVTVISSIVPIYRALKIEISQCLKE